MLKSEGWGEVDEGVLPRRGARLFTRDQSRCNLAKFIDTAYDPSTNNPIQCQLFRECLI